MKTIKTILLFLNECGKDSAIIFSLAAILIFIVTAMFSFSGHTLLNSIGYALVTVFVMSFGSAVLFFLYMLFKDAWGKIKQNWQKAKNKINES